ncbi:hypothetical protein [Lactovum odontotermitis]
MKEKYKKSDKYVTFVSTGTEFILGGSIPNIVRGFEIITSDKNYIKYGFSIGKSRYVNDGEEFYYFPLDTVENLRKVTNAYDLHYEANYQGERYGALFNPGDTIVTLRSDHEVEGFQRMDKFYWDKDIDISEVEIIPVKEPIDLVQFLPKNTD